jgi:hypothetical protein
MTAAMVEQIRHRLNAALHPIELEVLDEGHKHAGHANEGKGMRLSTIKLRRAGFKSFVDPTTLHLPSNMIGVVRSERLRQIQHHRRDPLGDGRERGQPSAR